MKSARFTKSIVLAVSVLGYAGMLHAQQLAFPTAEGYGKYSVGGRGGKVYEVTTLKSSGPGSLGEAIGASGPRTVVFRVAGTITGNFRIRNNKITIAGQTAPGDGICIKGSLTIDASNVIIRYIRVRANPTAETDAIWGRYHKNIILDHVSASWSSDEVMSPYHNENVTIQWCMITEACAKSRNGENIGHRFGGIWGNNYGTYHHNLIAHNDSRNPRWASGCGFNDYRNNVLYNWGYQSCYGAEAHQSGDRRKPRIEFSTINMVANYCKAGPATKSGVRDRIAEPSARSSSDKGSWYVADNVVEGYPEVIADNWLGVDGDSHNKMSAPWDAMSINQESPRDAYKAVLAHAGCSKPKRDSIDRRIIEEVRHGTATYGNNGIITTPNDVGGWPNLQGGPAPVDSDHDGMPDAWESKFKLDPKDASDNKQDQDKDGYTNLEEYLNGTDPTKFVDYTRPENNINTLK
jgi:pectate lyase